MKREFLKTGDGSLTIHLPAWDEQYHSKHGAIAEAQHVFIKMGLHAFLENHSSHRPIRILEIGFGTGLNALLTSLEAAALNLVVDYTGVEAYPLATSQLSQLNYPELLSISKSKFLKLHDTSWEEMHELTPHFSLRKQKKLFSEIEDIEQYDIVYFDAFGARVQPDLWTVPIFQRMFNALVSEGVLTTYAANGNARRAMQEVGFTVERLPGPPGKKEMLRASKL
ncbi:MAG: tRNA (5-methylaminomethyl-2-thiouridine)(34)-methyltransferase MnmD [Flavobacteriales bacterium]|jgi:tRNA U34 5-methylaminomethyl-2-thiouridine-forming methyltransferase MnmC|uniref:tRNA (5-methylaminomethyl-2-thiouridine)(34)-methyltransferase MnmD n=1 Tax=Candidatus Ulvibacter alkanivorans TaxID=2267620 RepID=UPI000DF38AD0|nr:tRNA (5-methylaminomethyl-2-thiouridine)(34)-methyltransferase MnmD [Candidatus Ulvibacter alkanivorans]MCH2489628.1 tRNA (5-methylaminomethyl-2-thiouridine)(34)-methyltransferase MnmD [Flavobacteriales bacterium]